MEPGRPCPDGAAKAPVLAAQRRFSIIVPLFDCRDAGTRALESALAQDFPRDRYEVVAVVDARACGAWPQQLLARCERIVPVDADFGTVEVEIGLFDAGSRRAAGEYLYFIEGHTVLERNALRTIDDHLKRNGECAVACGRRFNRACTRLGLLIGANNDVHETRASERGSFTLGANSVIRRTSFIALGGFELRFLRFAETALWERARDAGLAVTRIDATLCTHHNDAGLRWLVKLLVATGRAKARFYATTPGAMAPRLRHPVYRWLGSPGAAALAMLPLRIGGPALIVAATALARRFPVPANFVYRLGIGCTDVSGFCFERVGRVLARRAGTRAGRGEAPVAAPAARVRAANDAGERALRVAAAAGSLEPHGKSTA